MDPESKLHKKLARTLKTPSERKLVQLLRTLRISLVAEMPELCFDYFSLQRRSSAIFDQVVSTLFPDAQNGRTMAGTPILPTLRIMEFASLGQTLHSNKVDASAILRQMGFGPQRCPLQDATHRLNAQLHIGITLDEIDLLSVDIGLAPSVHEVAVGPLSQVADLIQVMIKGGEGDVEIKKLHAVAGGTDYGCFRFSPKRLRSLYGDQNPQQVNPVPWTEIVYKSRKRDESRCQFREHLQTAGQKRINNRVGRKLGLEMMALMAVQLTQFKGKENGWSDEGIESSASLVEANIEHLINPVAFEKLSGFMGNLSLDPEGECIEADNEAEKEA